MKKIKKYLTGIFVAVVAMTQLSVSVVSANESVSSTELETQNDSATEIVNNTESTGAAADSGKKSSKFKSTFSDDKFDIKAMCGLSGYYRYGKPIPITITVTSKEADFEGIVRVILPSSSYSRSDATAYESQVMLTKGVEKKLVVTTFTENSCNSFKLEFEDSKGNKVVSEKLKFNGKICNSAMVGVLSEDFESLNYFSGALVGSVINETCNTVDLKFTSDTLPDNYDGLSNLMFLVINDYDTSKLSEKQINAINKWVNGGGVLIIGTGANYKQTVSGLPKELVEISDNGIDKGKMILSKSQSKKKESIEFDDKAGAVKLSVKGFSKMKNRFDGSYVWTKKTGSGVVTVTEFNLGLKPISNWKTNGIFAQELMVGSLEQMDFSVLNRLIDSEEFQRSEINANGTNGLFPYKKPSMSFLFMLIVAFAVSIIAGYFILKVLDKREFIWIYIPVLSIVMAAVIMLGTDSVRIHNPQEASVTLYYEDEENGLSGATAAIDILSPDTKKYNYEFASSLKGCVPYIDEDGYYYDENITDNIYDYTTAIRESNEGYNVSVENSNNFCENGFKFEADSNDKLTKGLDCSNIKETFTGYKGSFTNNTGKDLKCVILVKGNELYVVGNVENGKSAKIDFKKNKALSLESWIWEDDLGKANISEKDAKEYRKCYYPIIINSVRHGQSLDKLGRNISIYGVIDDFEADYIKDKNIHEINAGVVNKNFKVKMEAYEDAEVVELTDYLKEGDPVDNYGTLSSNPAEITISLIDDMEDVRAIYKEQSYDIDNAIAVKTYIWNYKDKKYENILGLSNYVEFKDKKDQYMSDKKEVKFKFEYDSSKNIDSEELYAPDIFILGGKPHVTD